MIHRSTEKTICFFYAPVGRAIFPRTPHAWEIIRRLWLQVHGNLTPAGYSASSVEKYHYPRICYRLRRLPSGLSLHGQVPLILYRSHRVPAGLAWGVIFLPMPGMYLMNVYSVVMVLRKKIPLLMKWELFGHFFPNFFESFLFFFCTRNLQKDMMRYEGFESAKAYSFVKEITKDLKTDS